MLWREMRAQSRGDSDEANEQARALQRRFELTLEPSSTKARRYDDVQDLLHDWVHRSSLPRLLLCNDKMAMANSVEGRAPFLDHEFVDYAFSLDSRQLLVDGLRKFPLREAMRGLVPDEILFRRSKEAFHAPIFQYLRAEPIERRVREIFAEPRTAAYFNPRAYLADYERFLAQRGGDRLFLLHGLFLEEWARMFEVELG
jgi:asparagine synthase (glutamine-hydrolysing)